MTDLTAAFDRDPVWGPMSHPALDSVPDGSPPWKDHIYLAFWDPDRDAWGYFHWNNSPNHATTKAQVCIQAAGERFDFKENLPPSTDRFASEHIDFDMAGSIRVATERLAGELEVRPRFGPVDYGANGSLPPLVPDEPLEHYQQGLTITAELRFDGRPLRVDGLGMRSRTWGWRDDSVQFEEYVSMFACFEEFDVTAMKFRQPDGGMKTDGGRVGADGPPVAITDMHITRDPSGLPVEMALDLEGGDTLPLAWTEVFTEFWCPIGPARRTGPTMAPYDQFMALESAGAQGYGISEQAIVRHVF